MTINTDKKPAIKHSFSHLLNRTFLIPVPNYRRFEEASRTGYGIPNDKRGQYQRVKKLTEGV